MSEGHLHLPTYRTVKSGRGKVLHDIMHLRLTLEDLWPIASAKDLTLNQFNNEADGKFIQSQDDSTDRVHTKIWVQVVYTT